MLVGFLVTIGVLVVLGLVFAAGWRLGLWAAGEAYKRGALRQAYYEWANQKVLDLFRSIENEKTGNAKTVSVLHGSGPANRNKN